MEDVAEAARLCDSLPELDFVMSGAYPDGMDAGEAYPRQFRAMFQMMGVFAEFEREMIRARVNAGMQLVQPTGKNQRAAQAHASPARNGIHTRASVNALRPNIWLAPKPATKRRPRPLSAPSAIFAKGTPADGVIISHCITGLRVQLTLANTPMQPKIENTTRANVMPRP